MGSSEAEIQVLNAVVQKLDSTLDRVVELTNDISKLLAVQEQRLSSVERQSSDTKDEVKDLERKIYKRLDEFVDTFHDIRNSMREELKSEEKSSSKKLDAIEIRIRNLENWKWKVVGAVSVISFLAGMLSKYLPNLF